MRYKRLSGAGQTHTDTHTHTHTHTINLGWTLPRTVRGLIWAEPSLGRFGDNIIYDTVYIEYSLSIFCPVYIVSIDWKICVPDLLGMFLVHDGAIRQHNWHLIDIVFEISTIDFTASNNWVNLSKQLNLLLFCKIGNSFDHTFHSMNEEPRDLYRVADNKGGLRHQHPLMSDFIPTFELPCFDSLEA